MFQCRACNSSNVESIIPLGKLPLANALLPNNAFINEPTHNLEVMLCADCGLAQLRDLVDPKELFTDYVYFSSNSDTMLQSCADLVNRIIPTLPANSFVVEVASNDGYLLKNYVQQGIQVLGIDPAQNIAKVANERGINTLCDFFGSDLAQRLAAEGKQADVIHANNVMAHVPDINGFIEGIKHLLKPNGMAVIEVPHFLDLVEKLEFDTIYHEHVYYFAVKPLQAAFSRHGLELFNIEKIAIHGGSLRMFVGHAGAHPIQAVVATMIAEEEQAKLFAVDTYKEFGLKLAHLKAELIKILTSIKATGGKIAAYGASAKGTTLLNYFGIGKEYLDFVVDRSTVKQGLFTPGTQIAIKAPQSLLTEKSTHALLLVWNFAEEVMQQQIEFINSGGKFIVPLPNVRIA